MILTILHFAEVLCGDKIDDECFFFNDKFSSWKSKFLEHPNDGMKNNFLLPDS